MKAFHAVHKHYALLFVAALLSVSPLVVSLSPEPFRHAGGDIWFYLVWIRCFSEQFWAGDLYPRWCMDVNGGLGTPLFLFYFPLPFYIAALLYPLTQLGLGMYGLFVLLSWLAGFFAACGCFSWLKDIVRPPYALLASVLFLFLPYHLEMVFFRGAYAEMWCVGLVPLLFKYTRRLSRGEGGVLPLALVTGLLLLTHVPVAAESLLFSGAYLLAMTGSGWKAKLQYGLAVAWGVAMTAFYLVPGAYYRQFLAGSDLANGLYGWPNNYFIMDTFLKMRGLERPLIATLLNILLLFGFTLAVLVKYRRIGDIFIRREALLWAALAALALFLLFPASAPLYALLGPLSKLVFPWRMQMIVMLGTAYLAAVWMQWQCVPRKTWKTDFSLALFLLLVVGNFLTSTYSQKSEALNETIREAKIIFAPEYRSLWTDKEHWEYEYLLAQSGRNDPKAVFVTGVGTIAVRQWDWRGLILDVASKEPATLRLRQSYFPLWQARLDTGEAAALHPEDRTGLMLLDMPAGRHEVKVKPELAGGPWFLLASQWVSLAATLALLLVKIFDIRRRRC